jgi:Ca2+/Na+ antiporter
VEVTIAAIKNGTVTLRGALEDELKQKLASSSPGLGGKLINDEDPKDVEHLKEVLKPFFKRYDADSSGSVSETEFMVLLADLGVLASFDEKRAIFKKADLDKSGTIDMAEFVKCTLKLVLSDWTKGEVEKKSNKDEEPEEEDDMPDDLVLLTPAEQQTKIKKRAGMKLLIGSLLVLIFSDPMCDMLGVIGDLVKIPKFYVAFLLAPLASNASELIAAMKLAAKKSEKSMVDSLSSLEGAAVMNNTFCMAIFVFLIIYQNLAFTYKAETFAIIFVEVLIGALALKGPVMKFRDGCIVLSCYPLCLGVVLFLENVCHLD